MFSTDKDILESGSGSYQRMRDYGGLVSELHIVVRNRGSRVMNQRIGNVFVYPTSDRFKLGYFWSAYQIAKKIIHDSRFMVYDSVVTTQDPFETGLVGYWLKKRFGVSLHIQIHTDFLSPYFAKGSIQNKVRVLLAKWLISSADGIRVVSERIKSSIISDFPAGLASSAAADEAGRQFPISKISVLPIFVDIEKIKNIPIKTDLHQKYPDHDFIILMASRLTKEKNIGLAIEAMYDLLATKYERGTNIRNPLLLIVGDGPEVGRLKLLTTHYSLQTNVVFEPWSDNLPSYYKTADLFLLTSNYEGYGRTVIEAAAAGLPVVMTDVGVAIGLVVGVGDRNGLVEKISGIIKNQESRQRVLGQQNKFLEDWPTRSEYLSRIKQSWQECFS